MQTQTSLGNTAGGRSSYLLKKYPTQIHPHVPNTISNITVGTVSLDVSSGNVTGIRGLERNHPGAMKKKKKIHRVKQIPEGLWMRDQEGSRGRKHEVNATLCYQKQASQLTFSGYMLSQSTEL